MKRPRKRQKIACNETTEDEKEIEHSDTEQFVSLTTCDSLHSPKNTSNQVTIQTTEEESEQPRKQRIHATAQRMISLIFQNDHCQLAALIDEEFNVKQRMSVSDLHEYLLFTACTVGAVDCLPLLLSLPLRLFFSQVQ